METESAKTKWQELLKDRVLGYIVDDKRILLGFKKRGFGADKYTGFGGKVEDGESLIEALIREAREEIGVTLLPESIEHAGVLEFYFPYVDEPEKWNQKVTVYKVSNWEGELTESDEIRPEWHDKDTFPIEKMWDDDKYWLREVLAGKKVNGIFIFDKDLNVESHEITWE